VQLDWSTFLLEIVNFLILVWLLKRFLYKPVLAAIAQRRTAIEKQLADAQTRQEEAKALEAQYRNRLAEWEKEKETLYAHLNEEIEARREKMMATLAESLGQEREKAHVLDERRLNELEKRAREAGVRTGVEFTARLFARIASPELESKLTSIIIEDLPKLPEARMVALRAGAASNGRPIGVTSAFPIPGVQRDAVSAILKQISGNSATIEFSEDRCLLAGLRIAIGPWIVHGNLKDELGFFAEMAKYDGE
jgi:F-type H+-transporting ATPase subunit b